MTVVWVGQKHEFGCMAAAAAMILGMSYEEGCRLLTRFPDALHSGGLSYFVLDSRLVDEGYAIARKYKVTQPGNQQRTVWPCAPWSDVHWCEVMTHEGARSAHAVVMLADGTVLDPASPDPRRLSDYHAVNFVAAIVPVDRGASK